MTTALLSPDDEEDDSLAELIERCHRGDLRARTLLIERFYAEVLRTAEAQLELERLDHPLQPRTLVHEALARFVRQAQLQRSDRSPFLAVAAQLMRQILLDQARARRTSRGGGAQETVTVEAALHRLDERQRQIVELHLLGGLTLQEIASVLGVAERTVKRGWATGWAWLAIRSRMP